MDASLPTIDSIAVTSEWSGIDAQQLYRLVNGSVIPPGVSIRIGRRWFINRERFLAWLEAGGASYEGGWKKKAA